MRQRWRLGRNSMKSGDFGRRPWRIGGPHWSGRPGIRVGPGGWRGCWRRARRPVGATRRKHCGWRSRCALPRPVGRMMTFSPQPMPPLDAGKRRARPPGERSRPHRQSRSRPSSNGFGNTPPSDSSAEARARTGGSTRRILPARTSSSWAQDRGPRRARRWTSGGEPHRPQRPRRPLAHSSQR